MNKLGKISYSVAAIRVPERRTTTLQGRRDLAAYALYKFNPKRQLRVALSNLPGQDFVNRGSFVEEERGPMLREARIEAGPSLRATLELKF
jgi:hypothetical protein